MPGLPPALICAIEVLENAELKKELGRAEEACEGRGHRTRCGVLGASGANSPSSRAAARQPPAGRLPCGCLAAALCRRYIQSGHHLRAAALQQRVSQSYTRLMQITTLPRHNSGCRFAVHRCRTVTKSVHAHKSSEAQIGCNAYT